MTSKYVEALHGSDTQETVVLGSSQGTIEVEAVSLDKIRQKFARIDQLREISLEHANVVKGDEPGLIRQSCPSMLSTDITVFLLFIYFILIDVRGLDLSSSLLSTWEAIAEITRELPSLQRLSLKYVIFYFSRTVDAELVPLCSRNRLKLPSNIQSLEGAFLNLTDLQLNATFLSWAEMQAITSIMPNLQHIEMGYNHLSRLSGGMIRPHDSNIRVINLDTNNCSDWVHLCASFTEYHSYVIVSQIVTLLSFIIWSSLQRIVLTSNRISAIPFPDGSEDPVHTIKYLSLSNNLLNAWSDIDALSCWFPKLVTLTMSGNPLTYGDESRRFTHMLQFTKFQRYQIWKTLTSLHHRKNTISLDT